MLIIDSTKMFVSDYHIIGFKRRRIIFKWFCNADDLPCYEFVIKYVMLIFFAFNKLFPSWHEYLEYK
jgi:hypothetical protein